MSTSATPEIRFRDVWKKFRKGELHDSLRDLIPAVARRILRGAPPLALGNQEFWALQDVSFRVEPGEALGIIGRNGAGKSTVLKLLTGILRPTRGHCSIRGRVGALIEVAAGFHPDLTGRENVFLQGAIMGMNRRAIRRKFDDIVAFAEVEEFIDTPVKRYSSGMNARLGFSIAAHLDPEVMVIDEVLAVGDLRFQEKAFDRLKSIAVDGVPVVLVSHQLERLGEMCTKALVLDRGRVVAEGEPDDCIAHYVRGSVNDARATGVTPVVFEAIASDAARGAVPSGERLELTVRGAVVGEIPEALDPVDVRVRDLRSGRVVFSTSVRQRGLHLPDRGPFVLRLSLEMNVPPGNYMIETTVRHQERNVDVSAGPYLPVRVDDTGPFWGSVQMKPIMDVGRPGDSLRKLGSG